MMISVQRGRWIASYVNRRIFLPCIAPAVFITAFLLALYGGGGVDIANAEEFPPRHENSTARPKGMIYEDDDGSAAIPGP